MSPRLGRCRATVLPVDFDEDRFWSYVHIKPDCWPWLGRVDAVGYGMLGKLRAHRVSLELADGPLHGLHVHHVCGHPGCVRPSHLVAVDPFSHRRMHDGEAVEEVLAWARFHATLRQWPGGLFPLWATSEEVA